VTILRVERVGGGDEAVPAEGIERLVAVLDAGGVIACPTETVYGLSADYLSDGAAARIRAIKGIEAGRPFLLLIPDRGWLERLGRPGGWERTAAALATAFWPGPLTLLVPAAGGLPGHVAGPEGLVAVRESPDPFVRSLLAARPRPILSTSANPTGRRPATSLAGLRRYFGGKGRGTIDVAVDGGIREGVASTLVSLASGAPRVLRTGAIGPAEIDAVGRS
jgi:L-threonylcarbamoyladenylate synthase